MTGGGTSDWFNVEHWLASLAQRYPGDDNEDPATLRHLLHFSERRLHHDS